jgi:hypothetical protein
VYKHRGSRRAFRISNKEPQNDEVNTLKFDIQCSLFDIRFAQKGFLPLPISKGEREGASFLLFMVDTGFVLESGTGFAGVLDHYPTIGIGACNS